MRNKAVKYFALALIGFLSLWGCEEFFRRKIGRWAGSYPFVETWRFNGTEAEVITAIVELKTEHPEFQPPDEVKLFLPRTIEYDWGSEEMKAYLELAVYDSTLPLPPMSSSNTKEDSYWLYIDFYYPDTKEIVHTWTRPTVDTTTTVFAFVSLATTNSVEYKLINRDFWYLANKHQIKKFKTTFVDRIQVKIDEKKLNISTR